MQRPRNRDFHRVIEETGHWLTYGVFIAIDGESLPSSPMNDARNGTILTPGRLPLVAIMAGDHPHPVGLCTVSYQWQRRRKLGQAHPDC